MRRLFQRTVAALICVLSGVVIHAAEFPSKPIRIIVPYSPGGLPDTTARLIADNLSTRLGKAVIVENRPGANGAIGTLAMARAEPDGYTIGVVASSHVFGRALVPKLPFDPIKDFAPITMAVRAPVVLVASPTLPVKTFPELLAYVRARPDSLAYASAGNGSNVHVFANWFTDATGLRMAHAPYKGSAAAHIDLVSGQVAMAFDTLPSVQALVAAGKLKLLASGGPHRLAKYPDLPTVAEAAVPGFDAESWAAVLAPAKTPQAIVDYLNREIVIALRSEKVRRQISDAGAEIVAGSPGALRDLMVADERRYGDLIRRLGITLD